MNKLTRQIFLFLFTLVILSAPILAQAKPLGHVILPNYQGDEEVLGTSFSSKAECEENVMAQCGAVYIACTNLAGPDSNSCGNSYQSCISAAQSCH
ncbi:MAG: hypothetical protein U1F66_11655 [bacterium]